MSQLTSEQYLTRGARALVARGIAIKVVGVLATFPLARLLAPEDFGIFVLGNAIIAFGGSVAGIGLGAGLIRESGRVPVAAYRSLCGVQLAFASALVAIAFVIAPTWPEGGYIVATMTISLAVQSLRVPAFIELTRQMEFGKQARIEVLEVLVFNALALALALLGWGPWAFAWATIARSVVGLAGVGFIYREGLYWPILRIGPLRRLLSFGLRYQTVGLTVLARDQGLNAVIALVAGVQTLGVWALCMRLLQLPYILFDALWRVSYPALSTVRQDPEALRSTSHKLLLGTSTVAAALLVPLVAAIPLLPQVLLGPDWSDIRLVVPLAACGLVISGPVAVACAGYLNAAGRPGSVAFANGVSAALWLPTVGFGLPAAGPIVLGAGWCLAALAEAFVLIYRSRPVVPFSGVICALRLPVLSGVLSSTAGWAIGNAMSPTWPSLALSAGVAILLFLCIHGFVDRRRLQRIAIQIVRRAS